MKTGKTTKAKAAKPTKADSTARLAPYTFKPGQSGNPSGRPPGMAAIREQLRDVLNEPTRTGRSKLQVILRRLTHSAAAGNIRAIELTLRICDPNAFRDEADPDATDFMKLGLPIEAHVHVDYKQHIPHAPQEPRAD